MSKNLTAVKVWRQEWNCYHEQYDLSNLEGINQAITGQFTNHVDLEVGYGKPEHIPEGVTMYVELAPLKEKLLDEMIYQMIAAGHLPKNSALTIKELFNREV